VSIVVAGYGTAGPDTAVARA